MLEVLSIYDWKKLVSELYLGSVIVDRNMLTKDLSLPYCYG